MKVLSHQLSPRRALIVPGALFAALSLCAMTAQAQSGRRVNAGVKPGATPEPAPVIELSKPEPATPKRVLPKVALVIAVHIEKGSPRADTIVSAFATRLAQSMTTTSLGLVKHEEAEKRARSEKENYVIWLELDRDAVQNGQIIFNSPDYVVRYSVLAPQTAKVLAKGKVYYQAMGGARGRSGEDKVIKISPEAAGEAAADMALDWLAFIAAHPQGVG